MRRNVTKQHHEQADQRSFLFYCILTTAVTLPICLVAVYTSVYMSVCLSVHVYVCRSLVSASQDGKLIVWDGYTTNKVLFVLLTYYFSFICSHTNRGDSVVHAPTEPMEYIALGLPHCVVNCTIGPDVILILYNKFTYWVILGNIGSY